jgi:hypothetical protein
MSRIAPSLWQRTSTHIPTYGSTWKQMTFILSGVKIKSCIFWQNYCLQQNVGMPV